MAEVAPGVGITGKADDRPLVEPECPPSRRRGCRGALSVLGPGLMVCFADTDGPCLLTAAQSGASWGYRLLLLQLVMIPILFCAQELTVRLGLLKGRGIVGLLKDELGPLCAWLVGVPLLVACVMGLLSEYSVIGQTMKFWSWPVWLTNTCVTTLLLGLALSGSYHVAEKVGLAMGLCQVVFLGTMFAARPEGKEVLHDMGRFPLEKSDFVKLVTANIGAVIMPWMLAYQQSAVCQKGLSEHGAEDLALERLDTGLGSVLTQAVMAAMLVTVAAAIRPGETVDSVDDLETIFARVLGGGTKAKGLLTFAMVGACLVAAIVQTLCAAWICEEALGGRRAPAAPREQRPARPGCAELVCRNVCGRPLFHAAYLLICAGAFLFTVLTENAVDVSVVTEFVNGVLMPPVIFALWYLSAYKLPAEHRLGFCYRWLLFAVFAVCSAFCLGSIFFSFQGDS